MLYSRTMEDRKISFFVSMLKHMINGELDYAQLINPVIADVHALTTGTKNYFTIDRDSYPIIVYLSDKDNSYFANLDLDNLNADVYLHINELLEEQPNLVFA